MSDYKIGDCVYHKSNPTIVWIIEKIENNKAFCSTIIKGSNEYKEEIFELTSIMKCDEQRIIVGGKRRNNHY